MRVKLCGRCLLQRDAHSIEDALDTLAFWRTPFRPSGCAPHAVVCGAVTAGAQPLPPLHACVQIAVRATVLSDLLGAIGVHPNDFGDAQVYVRWRGVY